MILRQSMNSIRLLYNWGYDPVQYNALEGSYSTNPKDPFSRIKEYLQLISFTINMGFGLLWMWSITTCTIWIIQVLRR